MSVYDMFILFPWIEALVESESERQIASSADHLIPLSLSVSGSRGLLPVAAVLQPAR